MALKKDRSYPHEPADAKQQMSPRQIHEARIVADLPPGEALTLTIKTPATLDQVKRALTITTLTDSFSFPKPDYRVHTR